MSFAMSEVAVYIRKLVGKFERAEGIRVFPVFDDHVFRPSISVDETEQEISFSNTIYIAKLAAEGCDIYINFDRNIGSDDYTIVWAGTSKIVGRKTSKIYAKAPTGLTGTLRVEGLVLNA